jgi:hypothetical protein
VQVPEPCQEAVWTVAGLNSFDAGVFGEGAAADPLWLFGDASGGKFTASPRLRRVGLAVVHMRGYSAMAAVRGPLAGPRQVVPCGELKALAVALWGSRGDVIYVSDCDAVVAGWYAGTHLRPSGEDADLWREVGELARGRSITALFTHSHLIAADVARGHGVSALVVGNAILDELAGLAAVEAQIPQADLARVLQHERRAYLVRLRLLRAALDSMKATEEAEREVRTRGRVAQDRPPPPPSAAAVSSLLSPHSLSECKQKCSRCFFAGLEGQDERMVGHRVPSVI